MNNVKYIIAQSVVILGVVLCGCIMDSQRKDLKALDAKVDALHALIESNNTRFNIVKSDFETGWIHDGWCTLLPCCKERCVCHDHCGPICSTWRKNVMDGIIPIDNGLEDGTWYTYEDVIRNMVANMRCRNGKDKHTEEAERSKVVRLCDWMKEQERLQREREERFKRENAGMIERMRKMKGSDNGK